MLCGTVIPYESVVDTEHIRFGTSGLLYRSNKVMFDHGPAGGDRHPVALSVDFLEEHPVFQAEASGHAFVIVTSLDGANRVYRTEGERFERRLDDFRVADADGRVWRVTENELVAVDDAGARLARLPANRAFRFGWFAQFPLAEQPHQRGRRGLRRGDGRAGVPVPLDVHHRR